MVYVYNFILNIKIKTLINKIFQEIFRFNLVNFNFLNFKKIIFNGL